MIPHETIELFGSLWWSAILITVFFITIILWWGRNKATPDQIKTASMVIGIVLISRAVLIHPYQMYLGMWTMKSSLPLQMCGIAAWLSGIVMFTRNQRIYEVLYFWGLPGAFHSLMTPEFTLSSSGFWFFEYYLSHGGIILGALWVTLILNKSPSKGSWWKMFLWTQLVIPIVGGINYLINANYMYICAPPVVDNPFVAGQFPEHLIVLEFAGLLHFIIVYLPYGLKYRKEARLKSA